MRHILTLDGQRYGEPNRGHVIKNIEPVSFTPEDFAQLSMGLEYLYSLSDRFEIGLGYEYNSIIRAKKGYENNALKQNGSRELEKLYYSNNPVYLILKYNFTPVPGITPYLTGRLGISYNKLQYTYAYWDFIGPEAGVGRMILMSAVKTVDELKESPYAAFGFGIEVGDHAYFEGVYSWTFLDFSNSFLMSVWTPQFTVYEKYELNLQQFQFYFGYKIGPSKQNVEKPGNEFIGEYYKIEGFNISLGINAHLRNNGNFTHKPSFLNDWGEEVKSVRDISFVPNNPLIPNFNLEYLFRLTGDLGFGLGVMYESMNEYRLEKNFLLAAAEQVDYLTELTMIVPYFVFKYRFYPMKIPSPYLIGRIGYSIFSYDYYKTQGGVDKEFGGAKEIKNGVYYGLGFGMLLGRHMFAEMVYGKTSTEWKVMYDEEVFPGTTYSFIDIWEIDIKMFQLNFGYRF
ncbi:MAG TPA: hypothetical protein ENN73_00340 [Firmicutes bacterium]|nr:hypothetical protein [Bacillota bacterium]